MAKKYQVIFFLKKKLIELKYYVTLVQNCISLHTILFQSYVNKQKNLK